MVKTDAQIRGVFRTDAEWLDHACNLSVRGLGNTWPNPSVGCVVVNNGRVVGRGTTGNGGRPHAEVQALRRAGLSAKNAEVFVTLEPCSHHGKTPPCTDALINAGVGRVIIGCLDPDPRVNGSGLARLQAANIPTVVADHHRKSIEINTGFFKRVRQGRPFLTLKIASTLDGKTGMASGESRWITGPRARRHTHALRSRFDGILVGRGTISADNPMLDVRDMGSCPAPVRIVLDTNATIASSARIITSAQLVPTWIICSQDARSAKTLTLQESGAEIVPCIRNGSRVDLHAAMAALGERGLTRVLCEGGGTLAAALLAADLVDEVILYNAGKVIGADGLPSIGPLAFKMLADVAQFDLVGLERVGDDTVGRWMRRR